MKNLGELFLSFQTGIRSSKATKPREYLDSLGLDFSQLRIGFNSGQFHHRESQQVKDHYESLGLLAKSEAGVRSDEMTAYTVFGRYGLIFPLVDETNTVVNFYAMRFGLATPVEQYLNDAGLYPSYPSPNTRRLLVVPTVLDAASLMQSGALDQREAVLSLHEGKWLAQHNKALEPLASLEEILIIKP